MTINEWEKLYEILSNEHSNFLFEYPTMRNGKNKKIRADAERKVDNSIRLSTTWIRKYADAFNLLTGGDETSDFGRAIIWSEFIRPDYFGDDMSDYLEKIKKKIGFLEQENN
jgi:hypothetical protein